MTRTVRLVVADDSPDLLHLMREALEAAGYEVRTAVNGQEAVELIREDVPDIVILDLWMPIKDGFTVCRELKADPLFTHLPIVILSAAGQLDNKIQGLELGADDFITKPVDIPELLARIRMILRRTQQGLDANPLTRLPGNVSIHRRIEEAIRSGRPLAVLYVDLNNFKAYNDAYGYDAGDRVLKETGSLLMEAARGAGESDYFVGHIGGDDFIVVTEPDRMEALSERITAAFDEKSPSFYKGEDRTAGKIVSKDRQGNIREYPLLSVAIGVCHNREKPLTSYAQVSEIGAELKKFAKREPGSRFVIDRRKD